MCFDFTLHVGRKGLVGAARYQMLVKTSHKWVNDRNLSLFLTICALAPSEKNITEKCDHICVVLLPRNQIHTLYEICIEPIWIHFDVKKLPKK